MAWLFPELNNDREVQSLPRVPIPSGPLLAGSIPQPLSLQTQHQAHSSFPNPHQYPPLAPLYAEQPLHLPVHTPLQGRKAKACTHLEAVCHAKICAGSLWAQRIVQFLSTC